VTDILTKTRNLTYLIIKKLSTIPTVDIKNVNYYICLYGKKVVYNCTVVQEDNDLYKVIYQEGEYSGECIYRKVIMKGQSKPIVQEPLVLIRVDMGDIIEYIHRKTPLCSDNFNDINMEIRTDSRERVNKFISSPFRYQ
jgi:hypothetical protein